MATRVGYADHCPKTGLQVGRGGIDWLYVGKSEPGTTRRRTDNNNSVMPLALSSCFVRKERGMKSPDASQPVVRSPFSHEDIGVVYTFEASPISCYQQGAASRTSPTTPTTITTDD